ncbi:MAG: hypothetical protein V8R51_00370 [Clostridia bacterium]
MNICLIIIFIILALIAIFTYLVILGASMSKTNEERMIDILRTNGIFKKL